MAHIKKKFKPKSYFRLKTGSSEDTFGRKPKTGKSRFVLQPNAAAIVFKSYNGRLSKPKKLLFVGAIIFQENRLLMII